MNSDINAEAEPDDDRPDEDGRKGKLRWKWCLAGITLVVVALSVPATWVYATSAGYLHGAQDVPSEPVAIVFGAQVQKGKPSAFLAGRLDIAADLYLTGKVRAILATGDNGSKNYDEPDVMRRYLLDHSVPAKAVVADYAGFDTWDSCVRARQIFDVDRAILVSQDFHVPRAVALCRANGIEAYGVGHDSSGMSEQKTVYGRVREFFADGKAMWQALVTNPNPRFLGPKESGVTNVLASS